MALFDQINADIKKAMLAKEREKLEALRAVKSAFLLAKTDTGGGEISEADEIKIIQKLVKQRKDSAVMYKENGRDELYEKEIAEADVISVYLPAQMSEEDVKAGIQEIIAEVGAAGPKDMGKVMGVATKKFAGQADGKIVAAFVKECLNNM